MSKNMSSTSDRYEEAATRFNDAYNKYSGEQGLKFATDYGKQQAEEQAGRAGAMASKEALSAARSAGLSKAQAALLGEQAASDTTAKSYQNIYDASRQAALQQGQSTQQLAQGQTGLASQEGQQAYERAWGNVGGVGGLLQGVLSGERLKTFKDVSSKLDKPKDYTLLKVTYKKEK